MITIFALITTVGPNNDGNGDMIESSQIEDRPISSSNFAEKSGEVTTDTYEMCKSLCCTSGEISQPTDAALLQKTEKLYGSGSNVQKRHFLPSWYKSFSWVHFCTKSLKVYCFYCMQGYKSGVTHLSAKAEPTFTLTGFSNWKKATTRFKEHECSQAHRNALAANISSSRSTPINEMLIRQVEDAKTTRRKSLINQLSALRYLLRQGIAIRNDHTGGSNLTVMLQKVLDEASWVETHKYLSPEIINEMIELMAHKALRSLISNLVSQRWFSLLADETRDVSNREQVVVTLRWVSEEYEICEDFFGLIQVDCTTAEQIFLSLKAYLISLGIPFTNCRGQAYDGASNFQGHISGVAKRFQDENPSAISVHCLAHCINLCVQDIARKNKCVKDALNFAMEVIQLIKYSPKRQVVFESVQRQQQEGSLASGIRTLCPTRWTVRAGAMQAILDNYETVRVTMEVSSHGSDDCSRRASGMLALMDKFQTFFGLKLSVMIFSITEQLSVTTQGVNTSVDDCFTAAHITLQGLAKYRSDEMFRKFFELAKEEAQDKCDPPTLPRQRQIPRRLNDGAAGHAFQSVDDLYRKEYFDVIDNVKGDLERRFTQRNFLFVRNIESLLIDSANGEPITVPQEVADMYHTDLDMHKLKLQLQLLPDAVKSVPLNGIQIKQVTRIQTICDIFNQQPSLKKFLTEVHKLLKIYLIVPVTTASAERNFSALKRIKTFLRNSMTQQRLNHCMFLHIHQDRTDTLNLRDIAEEFIQKNERRIGYFGHFKLHLLFDCVTLFNDCLISVKNYLYI